jgi:hypothetical protein
MHLRGVVLGLAALHDLLAPLRHTGDRMTTTAHDEAVKAAAEALAPHLPDFSGVQVWAVTSIVVAAAEAAVQQVRAEAADNWRSWEREAGEHARTLGLIGAPKTGEPLSEGEQRRYEAAVERGLRKRAEDQRDAARAEVARLRAVVASVEALCDRADVETAPDSLDPFRGWLAPENVRAALTAAQDAPAPTPLVTVPGCGCSCHAFPGVKHLVACCDRPPFPTPTEEATP